MQVVVDYLGGMKFSAQCGKHAITIDLPLGQGGSDSGPTPPDIFLASLASCVGVYVAGFCKNHSLNAAGMKITIRAEKVQNPGRLDQFAIDISLPNVVVGDKRDAVLAVARKCLIHNTIEQHPAIAINLVTA